MSLGKGEGSVISEVFEQEDLPSEVEEVTSAPNLKIGASGGTVSAPVRVITPVPNLRMSAADVDHDGSVELFFGADRPETNRAFRADKGAWREMELPYPCLWDPIVVWLDYDGDGYPDLFYRGRDCAEDKDGKGVDIRKTVVTLYHNKDGHLEAMDTPFEVPECIQSAQQLDVNGDGFDDLLTYPHSHVNRLALATRLYLGTPDGLAEVAMPLAGRDTLLGMSRGFAGVGDLDGDGKTDLVVTGWRHENLAGKNRLTVVYKGFAGPRAGAGWYTYSRLTEALPDDMKYFMITDLDGDGDMDIIGGRSTLPGTCVSRRVTCLENRGNTLEGLADLVDFDCDVVPIDVDEDGLMDLVCFPGNPGHPVTLLMNRSTPGTRRRTPASTTTVPCPSTMSED